MSRFLRLAAAFTFASLFAMPVARAQQPATPAGGDDAQHLAQMRADPEMAIIHELVANHDRLRRTVTNLPDGIRTVTESDDPAFAQLIKEHVAQMDRRVSASSDPGMPMESPALRFILRNGDRVHTTVETTATGVVVVQTSADPETVAALQQHAAEVSDLVQRGMAAMQEAMMKTMRETMMGGRSAMPPGMMHEQHLAEMKADGEMKQHGDMAMGFDQDKATHHFTLSANGGVIAVTANDAADDATRDQIQAHLKEIATSFGHGDFEKPLMTHGEVPPGVSGMQRHQSAITYTYASSGRGGMVRITTTNADALDAIHDFLRYQIKEHATGDPVTVQK